MNNKSTNNVCPLVKGGQGHSAKQIRDSINAAWLGCGTLIIFGVLAAVIVFCKWLYTLLF